VRSCGTTTTTEEEKNVKSEARQICVYMRFFGILGKGKRDSIERVAFNF
jgi:hypothetical protein